MLTGLRQERLPLVILGGMSVVWRALVLTLFLSLPVPVAALIDLGPDCVNSPAPATSDTPTDQQPHHNPFDCTVFCLQHFTAAPPPLTLTDALPEQGPVLQILGPQGWVKPYGSFDPPHPIRAPPFA